MAGIDESTPAAPSDASRLVWLVVFFALVVSVFLYGGVGYFIAQNRNVPPPVSTLTTLRVPLYGVALLSLLGAAGWMMLRTAGRIGDAPVVGSQAPELMPPGQFSTESIVALALAEVSALLGLVLLIVGARPTEFAIFAAGTLLVDFLFILPRGLKYWTAWEARQRIVGATPAGPFSS